MNRHFWLNLARWVIVAYAVAQLGLAAAGVVLFPRYAATHLDSSDFSPNTDWSSAEVQAALKELGWPATSMAWIALSRGLVSLLLVYPVLFLLLWRKPDSAFALFVAFVFAVVGPVGGVGFLPLYDRLPGLAWVGGIVGAVGWQLFFFMFYLFPNGRPVPAWTRWLVWGWGGFVAFQVVTYRQFVRLVGPDATVSPVVSQVANVIYIALVLIAIGSQVYRYFWRSDTIQRQQTKWVVYALALGAFLIALSSFVFSRPPRPDRLGLDLVVATGLLYVFGLLFALIAAAIGLAILRYRLWDIDILIRRTLIYSALTGLLALAFFGLIVVLQSLLRSMTGNSQNQFVTVISTLAIAALSVPLRSRVQAFIDRRFYRRKYNAARTLAAFGSRLRDETDLEQLSAHLVQVVQDTMQPEHIALWLKPR